MTAFDTAVNSLFSDPNMAVDGIYTPTGGQPSSVRVILSQPDVIADALDVLKTSSTSQAEVRKSDIPSSKEGDTLVIGADTWKVVNPRFEDPDRLVWTMDLQ